MKIPTISYLEARDYKTGELLDKLYIGECNYDSNYFNLNYFTNPENMDFDYYINPMKDSENYNTLILSTELKTYHVHKFKNVINDIIPNTLDDENALYDMKLVLYWVDKMKEELKQQIKFVFVTYQAILENIEY